jgi:hypothetical protein
VLTIRDEIDYPVIRTGRLDALSRIPPSATTYDRRAPLVRIGNRNRAHRGEN